MGETTVELLDHARIFHYGHHNGIEGHYRKEAESTTNTEKVNTPDQEQGVYIP